MTEAKNFIEGYFEQKKEIQNSLLDFLQDTYEPEVSYYLFIKILKKQVIQTKK